MLRPVGLLILSACALSSATASNNSSALLPVGIPIGYELVWSDEFEDDGLPDPDRWTYDTHRNPDGWYNDELQYFSGARAENARIEDGRLMIEARKEPVTADRFPDTGGQEYTSSRLITKGLAAWKYGYFEIRAKMPCGRGLWPAIWTLPEGRMMWPTDGEIDIVEYVGYDADTFYATVHTHDKNHTKGTQVGATLDVATACGAFHTHSLHWTPEDLSVAVDGVPYFLYPKENKAYGEWPFDRPHYLLLSLAVGGTWGGLEGIDPDVFPARMEIDYVRIYQSADRD